MGFRKAEAATQDDTRRPVTPDDALAHLQDADPNLRMEAAILLSGIPGAAEELCKALGKEPVLACREAIVQALRATGGEAVVADMIPYLSSEDAHLRNSAVNLLAHLPDAVGPYMQGLLVDPDSDVRIFALDIMQELAHAEVPDWIEELLDRDQNVNVVATALDRLLEVGRPDQLDAVRSCAERFPKEPFVQYAARLVIERLEGVGE